MADQANPVGRYIAVLRELAEGRIEPERWLAWWEQHGQEVETLSSPGLFLRLKPRGAEEHDANTAALSSQQGACG